MEEVIQQLKTEGGLSDAQAQKAVKIMKAYIQAKVPPMFSGFVDKFFAKNESADDNDSLA